MFIENKYSSIYQRIIQNAQNRATNGYYELHHILPRCMGGLDSSDNLVKLSPREHFLCHRLLPKMTDISHYKDKLYLALFLMSHKSVYGSRLNSKMYSKLKKASSAAMRSNNPMHDQDTVSKFKESRDYSNQSEVCRLRNSEYWSKQENIDKLKSQNRERWADPEFRKRMRDANKNSWTPERRERASQAAKKRWAKRNGGSGDEESRRPHVS